MKTDFQPPILPPSLTPHPIPPFLNTPPPHDTQTFRVFYDRLVDESDGTWLFGCTKEVIKSHMKTDMNTMFSHLMKPDATNVGFYK